LSHSVFCLLCFVVRRFLLRHFVGEPFFCTGRVVWGSFDKETTELCYR
jgi:hypothetical protein